MTCNLKDSLLIDSDAKWMYRAFICLWILGLVVGLISGKHSDVSAFSLMRITSFGNVSIVTLLLAALLPVLITAIAVSFSLWWFLFGFAFLEALSYSFCLSLLKQLTGSFFWALVPLIFSGICVVPVYFWFCLSCLSAKQMSCRSLLIAVGIAVIIILLYHFVIFPFWIGIIDIR